MRYRLVLFSAIFLLSYGTSLKAQHDSLHYKIDAVIDVADKKITAHQQVSFVNRSGQPMNDVYFHLYPNRQYTPNEISMLMRYAGYFKVDPYPRGFVQGHMPVSAVKKDGKELLFFVEGQDQTLLKVVLSEPVRPGEQAVLELDFSVSIPNAYGRFGWHENIIKAAYWYPILCAQSPSGWDRAAFYPFHRPFHTDAARYEVFLRIPEEYIVIDSGDVVTEEIDDGSKTVLIKTSLPIRAFSFAMSPDYQWKESRYNDVLLRCYYLPGDELRAEKAVENLKHVFAFYEKYFGPYPYARFFVAPVHLGYGGEQMANMIFIDTRAFQLPKLLEREFDYLIAHEAGHQWFYNLLGVNGSDELWLEEAVNSYFSLQYIEDKYGYDADILEFPEWFQSYRWMLPRVSFRRMRDYRYQSEVRMGHDGSLDSSLTDYDDPSRIFSLTYGKGVRVLEGLRDHIGEEAFLRVFKKAVTQYRFQNWTGKDFMRLCEQEAKKDLEPFFAQYFFGTGRRDYRVRVQGRRVIVARQGEAVHPVAVSVVLADGTRTEMVWDGVEKEKVYSYEQAVKKAVIDPDNTLFDLDRTNNVWPRVVKVSPVPLYIGLYDIPLFLSDDSYHAVIGPEINDGAGVKASFQKPYEYILYGGTDYRLGEDLWSSRVGVLKRNIGRSSVSLGAEIKRVEDLDTSREDLTSTKVYMRKDFNAWPYGLFTLQDHASFYLIRNQRLNADNEGLHSLDDDRNLEYRRREESIWGISFYRDRSAPYPDPKQGYRLNLNNEYGGHMFGGQQYFYRSAVDATLYQEVTPRTKIASRVKVGLGYPDDKDLFQLGGMDGLRGYPRKSLRGANAVLGAVEYRFPVREGLKYSAADNIFGLRRIDAGIFTEAGRTWFSSYSASEWKTDAGVSLRFHVDIGGFLEKIIVQMDAAQAINDSGENPRFWLSVNSLF